MVIFRYNRFTIGFHIEAPHLNSEVVKSNTIKLLIPGTPQFKIADLPGIIDHITFWDGDFILLWTSKPRVSRNVARYDIHGNRIWLIQEDPNEDCGFQTVSVDEHGNLKAVGHSFYFVLNPDTGEISNKRFFK